MMSNDVKVKVKNSMKSKENEKGKNTPRLAVIKDTNSLPALLFKNIDAKKKEVFGAAITDFEIEVMLREENDTFNYLRELIREDSLFHNYIKNMADNGSKRLHLALEQILVNFQ